VKTILARLAEGAVLTAQEAEDAFARVMDGQATPTQVAGLLTALRVRGETQPELLGAVRAARARMTRVTAPPGAIDVCGTGGDGMHTLNVSTATAFVVAACGVPVAKHGGRAISSSSGAADVLAELGIAQTPAEAESTLASDGLGFLFAPNHHLGFRHGAQARAELGFRTLMNLIGPAANPAGVTRQLVGVFAPAWLRPMAETLAELGATAAWVIHGAGLDELTLSGPTHICAWQHGTMREFIVTPDEAGLPQAPIAAIAGGAPAHNAAALLALLRGEPGPYRDTVLLNAAAALLTAGMADELKEAAQQAAAAIDSGAALAKLDAIRAPILEPLCP
jgi:anthranilate phosphoribosyltransferase